MKNRQPIGILGATGMVGQRYIQLLEDHPLFEITWLAASDRSSGKTYGEAAKWRLDTPLPERIARMQVSPAEPDAAPRVIFASVDAPIARELEPKFADAVMSLKGEPNVLDDCVPDEQLQAEAPPASSVKAEGAARL